MYSVSSVLLFLLINYEYVLSAVPVPGDCDCEVSLNEGGEMYNAGFSNSGFESTSTDPLAPWTGTGSVHFKGWHVLGNTQGVSPIYDVAINCAKSCWIKAVNIEGAGFCPKGKLTLYNGDKTNVIDEEAITDDAKNTASGSYTLTSNEENYAKSFRFVEINGCNTWHYRSSITMTQQIEVTTTMEPLPIEPVEAGCDDSTDYNLLFMIAGSSSMTETNYQSTISFIIELIENDINDIASLAALSYFDCHDIIYRFENVQNDNRAAILATLNVEKLDFSKANETQTLEALKNGLKQFKDNPNISNMDNNYILLFTDDGPAGPVCTDDTIDLLRESYEYNVRIIIIGITSLFDRQKLKCIAKNGDIYQINDFTSSSFQGIQSVLRNILCPSPACPACPVCEPQTVSARSAISYNNDYDFGYDETDGGNITNHYQPINIVLLAFCVTIIIICCIGFIILIVSKQSKPKYYVSPKYQDDVE